MTPQTTAVYNYSKTIVTENYDYKMVFTEVKSLNFQTAQEQTINWVETMRTKIIGGMTWENKIKEDFMLPIEGKVINGYGEKDDPVAKGKKIMNYGVDIKAKKGTNVVASYVD